MVMVLREVYLVVAKLYTAFLELTWHSSTHARPAKFNSNAETYQNIPVECESWSRDALELIQRRAKKVFSILTELVVSNYWDVIFSLFFLVIKISNQATSYGTKKMQIFANLCLWYIDSYVSPIKCKSWQISSDWITGTLWGNVSLQAHDWVPTVFPRSKRDPANLNSRELARES